VQNEYVIRGGGDGRKRLRLLANVLAETTSSLLDAVGTMAGARWLDVGCGGGDVTQRLARAVGGDGAVLGIDRDAEQLELARAEARLAGLGNVEFRCADVTQVRLAPSAFDGLYVRFVLTHLSDPAAALAHLAPAVRSGGVMIAEDIDFRGHFCHPPSAAFDRYVELYAAAVARRGGDANIGCRLPELLRGVGCGAVQVHIVQPAALDGNVKMIAPVTMELIAERVVGDGLATAIEVETIVRELHRRAVDGRTLMSLPRIVQAWGIAAGGGEPA
jgi:SAM-dependent methyltransferase